MERHCRGFSCPFEPLSEEFLDTLAGGYAREVVQRFVTRYARRIDQQTFGVVPMITGWVGEEHTFATVWDIIFGSLRTSLGATESSEITELAVSLALRLNECGLASCWEAQLDSPARFRIGRFLLPAIDNLQITANGTQMYLRIYRGRSKKQIVFPQPLKDESRIEGADSLTATSAGQGRFIILTREALRSVQFADISLDVDTRRHNSIAGPLEKTVATIEEFAPNYLSWVSRIVRYIIPLKSKAKRLISSSHFSMPGVVCISNQRNPTDLAEMLIHEGTHQYLYLLRRLGPVDDGSDKALYYSPVRGTKRPIGAIVAAYHAVGNVILFCRECPAVAGLWPRERETSLVSLIGPLEEALHRTQSLTPLGDALWKPLYGRLHK